MSIQPRGTALRVCRGLVAGAILILPFASADDPGTKLTPRQMYFKPPGETPKPETPPANKPATKSAARQRPKPAAAATGTAPGQTKSVPYLGLRYSIVQPDANGTMQEVDVEKVFHSGEHFGLRLRPNDNAYLYVVMQGSKGNWDVLFPYQGEGNRVYGGAPVTIPPKCAPSEIRECFSFDQDPGTEKLFVILSKQPEANLDALIYSVRQKQGGAAPAEERTTMAMNLPGAQFDPIRSQMQLESRGIVRETMRKNSGADSENAVYIVNASTADNSRVVADIVLKHQP